MAGYGRVASPRGRFLGERGDAIDDYEMYGDSLVNKHLGPNLEQQIDETYISSQDPDTAQYTSNTESRDSGARQAASQAMSSNVRGSQKTLAEYQDLGEDAYTVTPEMYQAMGWSPQHYYQYETPEQQVRTDTEGLDAQRAALGGYQDIYSQGGLTAIDRAAMLESRMAREREIKANQDAILRNAAEQGRGGSIMSSVMRGQAAQGGANMRALDDARMQALALGRKDAALSGMGLVGNQMQTSADAIDKFNTEMRADVQNRNTSQFNRGVDTQYNDEQQTGRDNVQLKNQAEQINKSAGFGARGKMADIAGARQDLANTRGQFANYMTNKDIQNVERSQQKFNNVIGGAGLVLGAGTGVTKALIDDEDE